VDKERVAICVAMARVVCELLVGQSVLVVDEQFCFDFKVFLVLGIRHLSDVFLLCPTIRCPSSLCCYRLMLL
jgi:hypothetical protein